MAQPALLSPQKDKQTRSPITKACDTCRQKKIRCDVVSGACAQCIKSKTPCHFTPISTKRAPRRLGRDKRIEELEKRLRSMEDLMKRPVPNQSSDSNDAGSDSGSGGLGASPFSDQSEVGTSASSLNLDPASAMTGEDLQASDFGLPSLEGGCESATQFSGLITSASPTAIASSETDVPFSAPSFDKDVPRVPAMQALPSKEKMLSLVEKSFQGFEPAFPLFDKARFMSVVESPDTTANDPGRWACLNVVLALTGQFQHGTAQDMEENDDEKWGYFQTAFAFVGQLMTMHVTLWSVQALLGMALVMQGTPNQGPVSLLIAGAMKLAHRLGLHRRCLNPNISAAEIEERKRVFWIAYSLDKDLSLRMGQPSGQDDDDMDVELPSDVDSGLIYPGESTWINIFKFRAKLAMIQGQIYKRLYSVKATKATVAERVVAATELEAMLQSWRESVPFEFIQETYGNFLQMPSSGIIGHPIILQLVYFNSLAMIHNTLPQLPRYGELQGREDSVEFHLMSASLIYETEARKAIKLLQITPRRRFACIWAVLYIFVAAATTLLKAIVREPSNPMALSDLETIEPLLTLLVVLAKSSEGRNSERLGEMHRSCLELFKRANAAVQSTLLAGMDWDQCTSQERESLEDFLRRMDDMSSGHDVELDCISPGVSREFAYAVQQQFQQSMST